MNRNAMRVERLVQQAWDAVRAGILQMYGSSNVQPSSGFDIFKLNGSSHGDLIVFDVHPIVFHIPERATHREANLYVAVRGSLSLDGSRLASDGSLQTASFSTVVGYFRAKKGRLEHVYGVHYDLDEERPGHPVFHAQVSSQMDLVRSINGHYRKEWEADNKVGCILPTVRIPSAQMDVFSAIAQICADHLIHSGSTQEVRSAFKKMRAKCDFFGGAAYRMKFLHSASAPFCYRSTHWYGATESQTPD